MLATLSLQTSTPQAQAQVQSYERTVECTRCTNKSGTPPFIQYTLPIAAKPAHCPKCGHTRTIRPYDYADIICTDHAGIPRSLAIRAITLYNEFVATSTLKHRTATPDCIAFVRDHLGAQGMPSMRTSFTPLDVSCTDCGGSYTMLRTLIDVQHTPPCYCVWCGSKNVTIQQQSTEQSCWTSLAMHYNLPVQIIKMFYDRWSHKSAPLSFSEYMHSDLIQSLLKDSGLVYTEQQPQPVTELPAMSTFYANTLQDTQPQLLSAITTAPTTQYNQCDICQCELPIKSVKAYCEPCQLVVKNARHTQHTFTSKGGC